MPGPLIALLPWLAEQGLGLLKGAVEAKGKEVVEDIIGVKLPTSKEEMTPELAAKLKELEYTHEEKILALGLEKQRLELEEHRLEAENTDSARRMQVAALQQDDKFAKRFVYYLATAWSAFAMLYVIA